MKEAIAGSFRGRGAGPVRGRPRLRLGQDEFSVRYERAMTPLGHCRTYRYSGRIFYVWKGSIWVGIGLDGVGAIRFSRQLSSRLSFWG